MLQFSPHIFAAVNQRATSSLHVIACPAPPPYINLPTRRSVSSRRTAVKEARRPRRASVTSPVWVHEMETGWRLQPSRGLLALVSPPLMSSRHHNLEPYGRWHATLCINYVEMFLFIYGSTHPGVGIQFGTWSSGEQYFTPSQSFETRACPQ